MENNKKSLIVCILIFLCSLTVFVNGLNVHGFEFRDDEVFYYKSTKEMVQSGNILSPKYFGEDRFQKPILFYWLILLSYKIFGVSWFSARIVSSLFAALTLVLTWLMARSLFNKRVAHLSVIILSTVPLFFRHAKNAVPDMALNFFIVLAIFCFLRFIEENHQWKYSLYFFIACAFGFMIKGFAAIIFPFLTVIIYSFYENNWAALKDMRFFRGTFLMLALIFPWFLYMIHIHGTEYISYMWQTETADRLLKTEGENFFLVKAQAFLEHLVFYFQIILQQYAPWSIFAIMAIVLSFRHAFKDRDEYEPHAFLLGWILAVYIFFSFMYFTISHYMLVLSTPLAILTSYFLLNRFEEFKGLNKFVHYFRKYFTLFIFTVLMFAYSFILIFFGGVSSEYIFLLLGIYVVSAFFIFCSRSLFVPPLFLGALIVAVCFQTAFLSSIGLTTHTTLRKFAQAINQERNNKYVVGVGSHDLHEKEFQIYFSDVKIQKVANDNDKYTTYMLNQLFNNNKRVYCLITEKDYNKYLKDIYENHTVIHEEHILRKRLDIDKGFVKALIRFDRETIHDYFMENVVLVQRDGNV